MTCFNSKATPTNDTVVQMLMNRIELRSSWVNIQEQETIVSLTAKW